MPFELGMIGDTDCESLINFDRQVGLSCATGATGFEPNSGTECSANSSREFAHVGKLTTVTTEVQHTASISRELLVQAVASTATE